MDISTVNVLVTAVFGLAGIALSLKWGNRQKAAAEEANFELIEAEERQLFIRTVVHPAVTLPKWSAISLKIEAFQSMYDVSRVILFVCVNGKHDPKETNGIFQWRSHPSAGFHMYLDVDIARASDRGDYISRIHETKSKGKVKYLVKDLPDCLIRDILVDEGIIETLWVWLGSVPSHRTKQVGGVYLSASAETAGALTPEAIQAMQNLSWELSGILKLAYASLGYEMIID